MNYEAIESKVATLIAKRDSAEERFAKTHDNDIWGAYSKWCISLCSILFTLKNVGVSYEADVDNGNEITSFKICR